MPVIAAIRTNKWTDEEERLLAALRPSFGDRIACVFHNRGSGITPPVPVVDLTAEWVLRQGLRLVSDFGWRCGDYFYYALRQAMPEASHYWLIEPDVFFSSDPAGFFARIAEVSADAMGYALGPVGADIRFTRGLPGLAHYRATFALTRFSGRALDRLFDLRRASAGAAVTVRDYPNDEIHCFSHIAAAPDMSTARFEDHAPDWFEGAQFSPDPDILYDALAPVAAQGRIYHPVRSREGFKRALGRRLAGSTGILMRMRESVDLLSDSDIEDVAGTAAEQVRAALTGLRNQRALRRRRQESRDDVA